MPVSAPASASAPGLAAAFDAHARDYDAPRRRLVPPFDAFYGAALDRIDAWGMPAGARVLDLGAGTGLLAALVKGRWPDARVELVDVSAAMLAGARARFAGVPGVGFTVADYAAADLGQGLDLVVSALSIHHLDDGAKRGLMRRVHAALRPGGLFVNAEQLLGPTPELEELYAALWRRDAAALGATAAELEAAAARMRFDRCAPLEDQLAWMRAAGFVAVDCCMKQWRFGVYAGVRPPEAARAGTEPPG